MNFKYSLYFCYLTPPLLSSSLLLMMNLQVMKTEFWVSLSTLYVSMSLSHSHWLGTKSEYISSSSLGMGGHSLIDIVVINENVDVIFQIKYTDLWQCLLCTFIVAANSKIKGSIRNPRNWERRGRHYISGIPESRSEVTIWTCGSGEICWRRIPKRR